MELSFRQFSNSEYSDKNHYLVIGNPISHSLSPVMHNIALREHGIDAEYFAIKLLPEEIPHFIPWMNRDSFKGCNITVPYKSEFLDAVDETDPEAAGLRAINTIAKNGEGTRLIGYNTDPYGFVEPLNQYSDIIEGQSAIVFGSGGAAKAVVHALFKSGIEHIVIVSRNPESVDKNGIFADCELTNYDGWQFYAEDAGLFVNTTPIGMPPFADKKLINDANYQFMENKICYDLIYNPSETLFLKNAKVAGAITINGLEMLIYQGNRSFEIWTGKSFPIDRIKSELFNIMNR